MYKYAVNDKVTITNGTLMVEDKSLVASQGKVQVYVTEIQDVKGTIKELTTSLSGDPMYVVEFDKSLVTKRATVTETRCWEYELEVRV